jgi:hypothetical protein
VGERRGAAVSPPLAEGPEALPQGSLVEDLDLADARVYQVDASEMQVVMIVHPSLEL